MKIFKTQQLNDEILDKGFVVVPFLSELEIQELSEFYKEIHGEEKAPFTSYFASNFNLKDKIDAKIKAVFSRPMNDYLESHIPYWGNFFSKETSTPRLPLHADFQYVNEDHAISLNIWCPLSDTDSSNGTLGVLPYSHKLINQIRGTNITDSYRKNALALEAKYGEPLNFKAGQAIIYDHRLLHYSTPNQTPQTRVAATLTIVPKGEDIFHFYAEKEGDTLIEQYLLPSAQSLFSSDFLQRPTGLSPIKTIANYAFQPVTSSDYERILKESVN
jgi:hypothetical protein